MRMQNTIKKVARALPWLMFICVFAATTLFFTRNVRHNLDSDISSEMILASLNNEEGTLLSDSWLYSTELRIISPVQVYQLGLLLTGNMHGARAFATAVMLTLYAASIVFMAWQLDMKRAAPWLATALMLPFGYEYAYIVQYGLFYIPHMAMAFTAMGLVGMDARKGRGILCRVLLALLGFWGGVNGVRMLTMVYGPMGLAALLLLFSRLRGIEKTKDALREPFVRLFVTVMLLSASVLAGFAVNGKLMKIYSCYDFILLETSPFSFATLFNQLERVVGFLGYHALEPIRSLQGVMTLASLCLCAMIVVSLSILLKNARKLSVSHCFTAYTIAAAIVMGLLFNMALGQIPTRYYLFGIIMLLVGVFLQMEAMPYRFRPLLYGYFAVVLAILGLQSLLFIRTDMHTGQVNYEMAADWLVENGYTQGYASFWNGNVLTEASNGALEIWPLSHIPETENEEPEFEKWLHIKSHMTEKPEGKVFLLVTEEENESVWGALDPDHLVGEDIAWSYYIYEYDSAEEMYRTIAEKEPSPQTNLSQQSETETL